MAATLLAATCAPGPEAISALRFWALGREGEVVGELVREFERRHPRVRIEVRQMPWAAARAELLKASALKAPPDVAQIGNSWVAEFAGVGALESLDAQIARSGVVVQDHYFTGIWETNVVDGAVYGLPWYVDTRLVFYRKDLLERAGYTGFPQTWSVWREAMERIRAVSGAGKHAILLPTNEWEPLVILALQKGSRLLRDRGRRGAFRERPFREAFDFYASLFRDGLASPAQVTDVPRQFAQGDFAMYITGPWSLGEFRKRLTPKMQEAWATAPMPAPDARLGGPGASLAGGASLVMFRGSRRQDDVWRLIEYLSEPEQQLRLYALTGDLPAQIPAWDHPSLAHDSRVYGFWEQLHHLAATPRVPEWERIATRIHDQAERAIRGDLTSDEALTALDADVDRILDERRLLLDRTDRSGGPRGGAY